MSTPEPPAVPGQPPVEGDAPPPPPPPPPPPSGGFVPGYPPPGGELSAYANAPRTSGKATAIMVLGIVGVVMSLGCGVGVFASIVALVLAPGAKREIAASGGALTGGGFIQAGVICAWISVALTVAVIAFYFGPSLLG